MREGQGGILFVLRSTIYLSPSRSFFFSWPPPAPHAAPPSPSPPPCGRAGSLSAAAAAAGIHVDPILAVGWGVSITLYRVVKHVSKAQQEFHFMMVRARLRAGKPRRCRGWECTALVRGRRGEDVGSKAPPSWVRCELE